MVRACISRFVRVCCVRTCCMFVVAVVCVLPFSFLFCCSLLFSSILLFYLFFLHIHMYDLQTVPSRMCLYLAAFTLVCFIDYLDLLLARYVLYDAFYAIYLVLLFISVFPRKKQEFLLHFLLLLLLLWFVFPTLQISQAQLERTQQVWVTLLDWVRFVAVAVVEAVTSIVHC